MTAAAVLPRRLLLASPLLLARPARATSVLSLPVGGSAQMRVFLHRAAGWQPDGPAIIVMHGIGRDAERYLAQWQPQADASGMLLVVPEFSHALFPSTASYNWGNVVDGAGRANPPAASSFGVIERVWALVRAQTGAIRQGYTLFGHSAGAQFVHRYLLLAEASAAETIIAANAGSYTMPVDNVAFPFGLGGTAVTPAKLAVAFARPVTILLGADDNDPGHASLPRQPGAMEQGPHRLARGLRFYAEARAAAARIGAPFRWRLETVPGVAHDNGGMARRAAGIARG